MKHSVLNIDRDYREHTLHLRTKHSQYPCSALCTFQEALLKFVVWHFR
jgi:hypothetical protein